MVQFIALVTFSATAALHLDLEMTSAEYKRTIDDNKILESALASDPFLEILRVGARNLQWRAKLAESGVPVRAPHKLQRPGLEYPYTYGPRMILSDYQALTAGLTDDLRRVLLGSDNDFPTEPEQLIRDFKALTYRLDWVYQDASRWTLTSGSLSYYKRNRFRDVRGFYFLSNEENLQQKLQSFRDQPVDVQQKLSEWLLILCQNSKTTFDSCSAELNESKQAGNGVLSFYEKYLSDGERAWASFFQISRKRSDLTWSNDSLQATMPFEEPNDPEEAKWVRESIENVWRWKDWHLSLDWIHWNFFGSSPYIKWIPGITPNVNRLAGSKISLDKNRSREEQTWTLGHEFGHVLGFPDCYIEFYDDQAEMMIGYQLDFGDLMCSRSGQFVERHFIELQRAYAH